MPECVIVIIRGLQISLEKAHNFSLLCPTEMNSELTFLWCKQFSNEFLIEKTLAVLFHSLRSNSHLIFLLF